ncbi:aminotransferase class I/II-fold pyridoxal phosphate-dependent enzyme [Pseudofrankia inefficax]|uniref:Aminotransferase class I and II n=1 Tax=Pseudofrankia inefficax (strain DSM 45817 / CECT 9037 / DDB 130130 / EuI1c) TaxID=298654 RepID=E3IU08_PSEI1|nr:aminotransferase class I/II-fold pyridoxal phosphate-dependent enzyme [Pseudofrankia inefficax]ADP81201.1 aminotransferase class I and II [Pseudofrankia inefficax]
MVTSPGVSRAEELDPARRAADLPVLRRVPQLPPYPLTELQGAVDEATAAGHDVIDLGFGNPDIPAPPLAVSRLAAALHRPDAHRYTSPRGTAELRHAVSGFYRHRFGVSLSPEEQVVVTLGAKDGLSQLTQILLEPGDIAMVPTPSYPAHHYAPLLAGASVIKVSLLGPDGSVDVPGFHERLRRAWENTVIRPRVLLLSFPHNPTTATVDLAWWRETVRFARAHRLFLVHDFAYADTAFDGYRPPSVLEVEGAEDVAVELYTMTKSFSMAGWRVAFAVGNPRVLAALARLRTYQNYGGLGPVQHAAAVALSETPSYPREVSARYAARRDLLWAELATGGWEVDRPDATMFIWARLPDPWEGLNDTAFARGLLRACSVAVSPGTGFGAEGAGHVRFALVGDRQGEAGHRIGQVLRAQADVMASAEGR